jgi:hypothetical protein
MRSQFFTLFLLRPLAIRQDFEILTFPTFARVESSRRPEPPRRLDALLENHVMSAPVAETLFTRHVGRFGQ